MTGSASSGAMPAPRAGAASRPGPARTAMSTSVNRRMTASSPTDPSTAVNAPLLLVFHGLRRNADEYRDHARAWPNVAACSSWHRCSSRRGRGRQRYQTGGLVRHGGWHRRRCLDVERAYPASSTACASWRAGRGLRCLLLGHSAGGPVPAPAERLRPARTPERVVVANPGASLFPTRDLPYPYGFGGPAAVAGHRPAAAGLPARGRSPSASAPRTPCADEELDTRPDADRQGRHRLERGRNAFRAAAAARPPAWWELGWRLVEAPGVGHDHEAVFDSPACWDALLGPRRGP